MMAMGLILVMFEYTLGMVPTMSNEVVILMERLVVISQDIPSLYQVMAVF